MLDTEIRRSNAELTRPLNSSASYDHNHVNGNEDFIDRFFTQSVFFRNDRNAIISIVTIMLVLGTLLGMTTPTNGDLTSPYKYFSNVIGYTYFFAWSVSFYPQVYSNYKRKNTAGLSPDYEYFNIIGFVCYAIFNLFMYYSPDIQTEYKDRNDGNKNKVQFNDLLFAVHAVLLTIIIIGQMIYYNGMKQLPSMASVGIIIFLLISIAIYFILVVTSKSEKEPLEMIDAIYFMSYVKMTITTIKCIPQVYLNYTNKSTQGWNIWNVILDIMGGAFSLLQLLLDCWDTHDWSGILGDPVKFGLGFVSIVYDIIFIIQHYVLYYNAVDYEVLK